MAPIVSSDGVHSGIIAKAWDVEPQDVSHVSHRLRVARRPTRVAFGRCGRRIHAPWQGERAKGSGWADTPPGGLL